MITFDVSSAPDLYIDLDPSVLNYTSKEIYSRWKDWVLSDAPQPDGSIPAGWPAAFRTIGGDDLGESRLFPDAQFIRNDFGWRLRKPDGNGEYRIDGNLLAQDPALPTTAEPVGAFTPTIRINLENVSGFDISGLLIGGSGSNDAHICAIDVVIDEPAPVVVEIGQDMVVSVDNHEIEAAIIADLVVNIDDQAVKVDLCPC